MCNIALSAGGKNVTERRSMSYQAVKIGGRPSVKYAKTRHHNYRRVLAARQHIGGLLWLQDQQVDSPRIVRQHHGQLQLFLGLKRNSTANFIVVYDLKITLESICPYHTYCNTNLVIWFAQADSGR